MEIVTECMENREIPEIKTAAKTDIERVIDTIVLAFGSDPIARWLYPTSHDYLKHFPEFLRLFAGEAFDHGTAKYVRDFSGAALWLPPDVHPDDKALAEFIRDTVPEDRQGPALAAFEKLEEYHPTEPHWHFAAIGVDPNKQRKGSGSALVKQALDTCDEQGIPVYLEASNTNSASLANRYGFERVGTVDESTMPPFIPMVRRP